MYQSPFCPLLPIKWMLCKKAKTQNLFFLLGVGGDIICKRDRWWVYWFLIVYTLLLPWQFFTLIYNFFRNVEIFNFLFIFPPSNKKILKENIEHSRKFYLVEMIFLINYLFIWQTLVQLAKGITIYDIIIRCKNTPPQQFGGYPKKNLLIQSSFF